MSKIHRWNHVVRTFPRGHFQVTELLVSGTFVSSKSSGRNVIFGLPPPQKKRWRKFHAKKKVEVLPGGEVSVFFWWDTAFCRLSIYRINSMLFVYKEISRTHRLNWDRNRRLVDWCNVLDETLASFQSHRIHVRYIYYTFRWFLWYMLVNIPYMDPMQSVGLMNS